MTKPHCGAASLPGCVATFILLRLLPAGDGKADFRVLGPPDPLLAMVGGDTELPCRLSPGISAQDMELRWYRDRPVPAVHVHKDGRDVPEEQMAEYHGRTTFVSDHVARGQAAVRVHNVTVFDNGTYHCLFKEHTSYSRATLWLRVAGLGSPPRMRVTKSQATGIRAECSSSGWYPEPWVEWRDLRGQVVPAVTHFSLSATTSLWAVVSSVTARAGDAAGLTCSVSNPLLPERKVAESHLPAPLSRRPLLMAWRPALPLGLIALGLVMAGAICLFEKQQREEHRTGLEEEPEQGEKPQRQLTSGAEAEAFHVSLSLDPDTASPKLRVSEDQKSVQRQLFDQDLPFNPRRFDQDPCVVTRERFVAGRYYWEVEVGYRKAWILGVCLESLCREGRVPKAPQHGLWAVEFYKKRFWALSYPRTRLYPPEPLWRVGIFLDYDAGEVSFYDGIRGDLIYTFSGLVFSAPLQPFFCLWTHDPSPLTLCSILRETKEDSGSPGGP